MLNVVVIDGKIDHVQVVGSIEDYGFDYNKLQGLDGSSKTLITQHIKKLKSEYITKTVIIEEYTMEDLENIKKDVVEE